MIVKIFNIVADVLHWVASVLGFTYNEVNIILYYFIIPLTWTILLDRYIGKPISTVIFILAWVILLIVKGREFRAWCDWAFDRSVDFLMFFNCVGGNYRLNSVIICVAIPILIYVGLILLQRFK